MAEHIFHVHTHTYTYLFQGWWCGSGADVVVCLVHGHLLTLVVSAEEKN